MKDCVITKPFADSVMYWTGEYKDGRKVWTNCIDRAKIIRGVHKARSQRAIGEQLRIVTEFADTEVWCG